MTARVAILPRDFDFPADSVAISLTRRAIGTMMNVPPTPWYLHYTLQQPWPLAIGLGVFGLISLWLYLVARSGPRVEGRAVGGRWQLPVGLTLVALAVINVIAAREIETSAERLTRLTSEFIDAAVAGDAATVSGMLADDAVLQVGRNTGSTWGPFWINAQVRLAPRFIQGNTIRDIASGLSTSTSGETAFAQTTRMNSGQPIPNEWHLRWSRTNTETNDWRLTELVWEKWNLGDEPSPSLLMGR